MSSKGPKSVASIVRVATAALLPQCPQECGIVTISDVEVSHDKSWATIYLSAIAEPKRAIAFFEEHTSKLQVKINAALSLKRAINIRFRHDERSQRGARMDELLG